MAGVAGKKTKIKIVAVAALILAVVILSFSVNANQFRPQIESRLSAELGRSVRLGKLRLSLFSGRFSVDDISIMDNPEFGEFPFITARAFFIGVKLRPLIFSKKVHITDAVLDHPSIYLRQSSDGKWNISDLGAGRGGEAKPVAGKPEQDTGIGIGLPNGKNNMDHGSAGKPEQDTGIGIGLPNDKNNMNRGSAGKPGQAADISIERLKITDGRVEIIKAGKTPAAYEKINLSVDNLSRGAEAPFTLAVALKNEGALGLSGIFGPLNRDDTLMTPIKMTLKGSGVPINELQEFLPPSGIMPPSGAALAGGVLHAEITSEGFLNNLTMDGTVEINGTSLAGFDLGDKIASVAGFTGLKSGMDAQIEKLYVSVRRTADGINVGNIQIVMPAFGDISGSGTISPRQELDFAMRLTVGGGALAAFTGGKPIDVNFFIRGTTADPEFIPDYKDAVLSIIDVFLTGNDSETGPANKANRIMDSLKGLMGR